MKKISSKFFDFIKKIGQKENVLEICRLICKFENSNRRTEMEAGTVVTLTNPEKYEQIHQS